MSGTSVLRLKSRCLQLCRWADRSPASYWEGVSGITTTYRFGSARVHTHTSNTVDANKDFQQSQWTDSNKGSYISTTRCKDRWESVVLTHYMHQDGTKKLLQQSQ